jgi:aminoglycoside 6'-N-acetyltransferase I
VTFSGRPPPAAPSHPPPVVFADATAAARRYLGWAGTGGCPPRPPGKSLIRIRNATASDLDTLTNVFVACFNEPPWNDGWTFEAARERLGAILESRLFCGAVAFVDDDAVGLVLGQKERWVDAFHFNLQEMCVCSSHQRKGLGRALLNHLKQELQRDGVSKMYLITGPDGPADAFYSAAGFYRSRGRIVMASGLKEPLP